MKWNALIIIFMSALAVLAGEQQSTADVVGFGDHLFTEGDYYRAITEYKRYQYLSGGKSIPEIRYRIAMSYYMGGKHEDAQRIFRELILSSDNEVLVNDSRLMLADSCFQAGNYRQAISFLQQLTALDEAEAIAVKIGWCELNAGDAAAAKKIFIRAAEGSQGTSAKSLMIHADEYSTLSQKSPFVAGTLSAVLPGAGQAYNGRWRDAAVSFIINGLTIWSAIEAFDNDENVAGAFATFFEVGWYSGNIYNAVSGAHKFNRDEKSKFLRGIRIRYGLSLAEEKDKKLRPIVGLGVQY